MKGMLNQAMNGAETPEEEPVVQETSGPEAAPANPDDFTPEEAEAIERVKIAAQEVLYDDKTHQGVMGMLKAGQEDPAKAIASVTSSLIVQLDQASGDEIPDDIIIPAAAEVIPLVAELAEKAGLFQADEQVQAEAMSQVFTSLGEHYGMSEEDMEEFRQLAGGQQGAAPQGAPV